MRKGHYAKYHRHREISRVSWTIETLGGKLISEGEARVPLNYAITEALENHKNIIIRLDHWDS